MESVMPDDSVLVAAAREYLSGADLEAVTTKTIIGEVISAVNHLVYQNNHSKKPNSSRVILDGEKVWL